MRILLILLMVLPLTAAAQSDAFRATDLPLPRFVSIKSDEAFARTGPGKQYPIRYIYQRAGLPLEITLEYGGWRKVRDHLGDEGWMHTSLLSGRRSALAAGQGAELHTKPNAQSPIKARLQTGVLIKLHACDGVWCKAKVAAHKGWIQQNSLWGVYAAEKFD